MATAQGPTSTGPVRWSAATTCTRSARRQPRRCPAWRSTSRPQGSPELPTAEESEQEVNVEPNLLETSTGGNGRDPLPEVPPDVPRVFAALPFHRALRSLHLRGPHPEEEGLLSQARLHDVRFRVRLRDELHLEGVRIPQDHVFPGLKHRAERLVGDQFDFDDAVIGQAHVLPGLANDVHDFLRPPFADQFPRHARIEIDDPALERLFDDVFRDRLDERHHRRVDADLLALDPDGVLASVQSRFDLPGVLGPQQDFDLPRPELVRGADGVHVDLHVDLLAAPHVVREDAVELFRPALSHDDLAERTHGVVAELVHGLDGDPRDGPVSLDPAAVFRLDGGLEGEPQEVEVRVHLLVRNLKGARFLRRDDRLADLTGDLLRRAYGRV